MRTVKPILFISIINIIFTISSIVSFFSCASNTDVSANKTATKTDEAPSVTVEKKEMLKDGMFEPSATRDERAANGKGIDTENDKTAPLTASIESAQKLSLRDDTRVRSPEMLSRITKPDMEPLPLSAHDISVVIVGQRARVVYDMVFENPTDRTLAGTLMIDLPQGASPCYLGMFQGTGTAEKGKELPAPLLPPRLPKIDALLGNEIKPENVWQGEKGIIDWKELRGARVVSPVTGREVYETVTRQRVDPALAEWAGGNKFSTRVFPIPPKSYKRVVFAYDRPLVFSGGIFTYPLPIPAELKASTRLAVHFLSGPGATGKLISGEKELAPTTVPYGASWEIKPDKNFKGNIIFVGTTVNKTLSVLAGSDTEVNGRLIHLLYDPGIKATGANAPTGRAVFLIDTSLSAKDKLIQRSGILLKNILDTDESIREFAVIGFDVRARLFTKGVLANTRENRASVYSSLEGLWLEGATNFTDALKLVAADANLAAADTYFLLSDGLITWGGDNPQAISTAFSAITEKRWICYTFGDEAVNRGLFSMLTHSGGQIVQAGLEQDLKKAALAHRALPAVLDSIYGSNQEELILAGNPRLLYPGQVLEIACRTRSNQSAVTFIISISGKKQTVEVSLEENPLSSALAARSWAELYANRLLDLYDKKANEMVLALAQHFSLSNREASFIILETDAEYVRYKINASELDIRELARLAKMKQTRFPFGTPETSDLSTEQLELVDTLARIPNLVPWDIAKVPALTGDASVTARLPDIKRPKETTTELYIWAQELMKSSGQRDPLVMEQALRALSSIVELKPQDDAALRLVGYVLLEWSLYGEAEQLFMRVRERRPFEPQNYILEAMALALQGKTGDAALRYEIVLTRSFSRFDSFVKPVTAVLYAQLLQEVIKTQGGSKAAALAAKRLDTLGKIASVKGRLMLFWNLDDTDVDLHVLEPNGEEVNYQHRDSKTGGKLFWDNTTGLGPELYEHPYLDKAGFDVFVNYFGSGSVEGAAPSATLVCAFTERLQKKLPELRFYTTVLVGKEEDKVMIMPKWKP